MSFVLSALCSVHANDCALNHCRKVGRSYDNHPITKIERPILNIKCHVIYELNIIII